MPITLTRVVHSQISGGSILIDKIDRSQGNFSGYAQLGKQPVYVPYANPVDENVAGYVDLVQTNEVLLASKSGGSIAGIASAGYVSFSEISSASVAAPTISAAANAASDTTIDGTGFTSVSPDVTYVYFDNGAGLTQAVPQAAFTTHTGIQIVIPDGVITIGSPGVGWTVRVFANSQFSATEAL